MSLELSQKGLAVKPSSTLAITAKAKELKKAGKDVVGFGAGEPDFNTPENISNAGIRAIENGQTKYTAASGMPELKQAVAEKFRSINGLHYDADQIVISNGGKHSLTNIFQAILNPEDEVIIPAPYWLSYPEIVKLFDGVPVFIYGDKANGYKVTAEQIESAVTDHTKALILNTPSNPTGMIYSEEELREIADVIVRKDIYVVADEMYEYLIYNGKKHFSIGALNDEIYKRTITCSGVSKSYAMTGWRIGYTGSSKELAKVMGSIQSHETSNPSTVSQAAALEALQGPQDTVQQMFEEFDKRRIYMKERFEKIPYCDCIEPDGAFYFFVDLTELLENHLYEGRKLDTMEFASILLDEYYVAVVPCPDFGYPNHIRLSYAISIEQIEKGMDRIEKFILSFQ